MIQKIIAVIVLLIFVALAWIGISVFDRINNVEINPNAVSYSEPIFDQFDLGGMTKIKTRIEEGLIVMPDEFHSLEQGLE